MALSVISKTTTTDRVLIVDESIYFVNFYVESYLDKHISIQKKDNAFRGGSRGKGGKTKYARK